VIDNVHSTMTRSSRLPFSRVINKPTTLSCVGERRPEWNVSLIGTTYLLTTNTLSADRVQQLLFYGVYTIAGRDCWRQ